MHYWKKTSWWRQCDTPGNVLLGNAGSHVDVSTSLRGSSIPQWYWPLNQKRVKRVEGLRDFDSNQYNIQ